MGFRHGNNFRAVYKPGNIANQIHTQPSVLGLDDPEPGDLVLVPIEVWLSSGIIRSHRGAHVLPDSLAVKFHLVDEKGRSKPLTSLVPVAELFCVEHLEDFISLTSHDYKDSMGQTKLFDTKAMYPGIMRYDYIQKSGPYSYYDFKSVNLFLISWSETDCLSVIPGVVESRQRKDWFTHDSWSQHLYKAMENDNKTVLTQVELPAVGMLGTVLERRTVCHSYDESGNITVGTREQTEFYRIILKGRRPMWFRGPVWKCPEELVLPIYMPVP